MPQMGERGSERNSITICWSTILGKAAHSSLDVHAAEGLPFTRDCHPRGPPRFLLLPPQVGVLFANPVLTPRSEEIHVHGVFHRHNGVGHIRGNQQDIPSV